MTATMTIYLHAPRIADADTTATCLLRLLGLRDKNIRDARVHTHPTGVDDQQIPADVDYCAVEPANYTSVQVQALGLRNPAARAAVADEAADGADFQVVLTHTDSRGQKAVRDLLPIVRHMWPDSRIAAADDADESLRTAAS